MTVVFVHFIPLLFMPVHVRLVKDFGGKFLTSLYDSGQRAPWTQFPPLRGETIHVDGDFRSAVDQATHLLATPRLES